MHQQTAKKDFLIRQVLRLPLEDRRAVIDAAVLSLDADARAVSAENRFAELLPFAEAAVGAKYNQWRRNAGDSAIRNLVAYEMREEGYTYTSIAKVMGRHYSSVITMVSRANDMREGWHGPEGRDKYNKFIELILQ